MSREQTKAAHYIQQLDEARCQGNWDAVPELVRKIRKHAPSRTCIDTRGTGLAVVAESEYAASQFSIDISTKPASISRYIPQLLDVIERVQACSEDQFQAVVCLGWVHWKLGEPALAVSRLPKNIEADFSQLDGTNQSLTGWTRICALKATYIKGTAQVRAGACVEALETFGSALPVLSTTPSTLHGKELRLWKELFLTEFCMVSSNAIRSNVTPSLEAETLSAFREWDKFWDTQAPAATGGRAIQADVPRRHVWKEYYIVLSHLLQQGLPYPTTPLAVTYTESSARLQQRMELKRVESKYETLLLSEVHFPSADQASEEVESFVEIAMQNWRLLCGGRWKEHDLGEGGSEGIGRGVLDILYRAATKTFHSTAVLRHLFSVHLALAEFELAFKTFDTYLDIVTKGKARVEKTGVSEHGLDDDETALTTISECIKALCRFGSHQGAERARALGLYLTDWLNKHHLAGRQNGNGQNGQALANKPSEEQKIIVAPRVFAIVWRCIGIAHVNWARTTSDASTRDEIQLEAITCFRTALSPRYESSTDVETLFALAIVLAERRELGHAIEVLKIGLLPAQSSTPTSTYTSNPPHRAGLQPGRFLRERSLIPLWHLMALLLSARQEFATAVRSCEGAFEQFQDTKNLFGEQGLNRAYQSDHLQGKLAYQDTGIVDDMDDFERGCVLEVKMTQLALVEVLEGPEIAVNASDELLCLYARLYGDSQKESTPLPITRAIQPPKSSAGTVRTIKGSIFGRTGPSTRKSNSLGTTLNEKADVTLSPTMQMITNSAAPIIQVTGGNESVDKKPIKIPKKDVHHPEKLHKRSDSVSRKRSFTARKRSSSTSQRRNPDGTDTSAVPTVARADIYNATDGKDKLPSSEHDQVGLALTSDSSTQPLPPRSQPISHKESTPGSMHLGSKNAPDNRPPQVPPYSTSTRPMMRFPKDQERRMRKSILVKVWLFIGGFYRRASMFDDAKGAINEAHSLVEELEADASKDQKGSISMQHLSFGGGKSVGELRSDIFAERGSLAAAESSPYIALEHFESALTSFADHPSAIVGLSNLLLDIYTKDILPPAPIPSLNQPNDYRAPLTSTLTCAISPSPSKSTRYSAMVPSLSPIVPQQPLGLPSSKSAARVAKIQPYIFSPCKELSHKESPTMLLDRLAARDRAYGLLSKLTKLGTGWNFSEAWFALARAYDEGGQPEKARQALWWCVELEEGRGVRDWGVVGGYK